MLMASVSLACGFCREPLSLPSRGSVSMQDVQNQVDSGPTCAYQLLASAPAPIVYTQLPST